VKCNGFENLHKHIFLQDKMIFQLQEQSAIGNPFHKLKIAQRIVSALLSGMEWFGL
jgi:hypothetical protein